MDQTRSNDWGSDYVHVLLKFRTREKIARLRRTLDTSLLSYTNLEKLIYKNFPEIEDASSRDSNPLTQSWRTTQRTELEVKWKDEDGKLIAVNNDGDLEALNLAEKIHVELHIDARVASSPTLSATTSRSLPGAPFGEMSSSFASPRYKTKLCVHFQAGYCKYGDSCDFIHNPSVASNRQNGGSSNGGTQVQRSGTFGSQLHGNGQDLPSARRIDTELQQRYKTKACIHFQAGYCKYGDSCTFIHNPSASSNWRNGGPYSAGTHLPSPHKLQQTTSFSHQVQEDVQKPSFFTARRAFQRPTLKVLEATNLEIDNWLIVKLELPGAQCIEQLSEEEGLDVLHKLVEKRNLSSETVNLLVRLLAKEAIRTSLLRQKTNSIYGLLPGSWFMLHLHSHIISYFASLKPDPVGLRPYLFLIEELQSRTAEGWREVPLDAMQTAVAKLEEADAKTELQEIVSRLLDQREKMHRQLAIAPKQDGLEGAEFRKMSIVATKEELVGRQSQQPLALPLNRIGYRYSLTDYLHTHFTLLREDCIHHLRQGIALYRQNCAQAPENRIVNSASRIQELRIYSDVRVAAVRCGHQGIEYVFQFDISERDDTPEAWETSRKLLPGALLCITSTQFQSFFWGVVARRNVKELAKGLVGIRLVPVKDDGNSGGVEQEVLLAAAETYVMVESNAYFEAYFHVLKNLQREDMEGLPFTRHLLDLEPAVGPPSYIERRRGGDEYDFSGVFPELREKMGRGSMKILQADWPAGLAEALGLDRAQLAALRQGLTKELAIIQGPPGTGKTFLGTILVKLLLDNLKRRAFFQERAFKMGVLKDGEAEYSLAGPLQIICYTNHALDQFLEGLYKGGIEDVIRIGGRSKSELLKNRTLFRLLEMQREERKVDGSYWRLSGQERSRKDNLEEEIHGWIDKMSQNYMTVEMLEGITSEEQICSLFGPNSTWIHPAEAVEIVQIWLSKAWCVDSSVALHYVYGLNEHEDPGARLEVDAFYLDEDLEDEEDWEVTIKRLRNFKEKKKARGVTKMLRKEDDGDGVWTKVKRHGRRNWQRISEADHDQLALRMRNVRIEDRIPDRIQEDGEMIMAEGDHEDEDLEAQERIRRNEDMENPLHMFKDAKNVWGLTMLQRRRLHEYWLSEFRSNCRHQLRNLTEQYEEASKTAMEVDNEIQLTMLRSARVVGMTTTAAAKYHDVMKSLKSEIVVIEEAAEVLEAHILACLSPSVQHLILIGDHQQLRPSLAVGAVHQLVTKCKLDVSMFERLVQSRIEHVTLEEQRRMRPTISKLMKELYPNSRDHASVHEREDVAGVTKNVFFFDHKAEECNSRGEDGSKVNPTEARLVVELCMYFLNQPEYGPENITILTMYGGQLVEIRKLLTERCRIRSAIRPIHKTLRPKVEEDSDDEESDDEEQMLQIPRVSSVDDFQGEESDIIILSLVRSNDIETKDGFGKIGFLDINNRVCVSLTRAKDGLFIFGNATLLAKKSDLWRNITESLKADEALGPELELYCKNHADIRTRITKFEDFKQVQDGGCNLPCEHQLDCGHACPRRCHPTSHDLVICLKSCLKEYEGCDHTCTWRCHGDSSCPPCLEMVRRRIPDCNHEQTMKCTSKLEDEICRSNCDKILPCGHRCQVLCGRACTENCKEVVIKTLPCGHSATLCCSQSVEAVSCTFPCRELLECEHPCQGTCGACKGGTEHVECKKECGRTLPCGHSCEARCYAPCPPCKKRCRKRCSHSRCSKPCGEFCRPCREPCAWTCPHHTCEKFCFEICTRPPCDIPCPKLLKCGHPCIGLCGEPCPSKCRVCHAGTKETFTQTELGEFEESDRLIQLEDCQHVFQVEGLDEYMIPAKPDEQLGGSVAIKLKECPLCRAPIFRTKRYSNSVKLTLKKIEEVKMKVKGYEILKEGDDHLARNDYTLALESYMSALNVNQRLMEAHFKIGCTFFLAIQHARAIVHLSFIVERSSFAEKLENLINRVETGDQGSFRPGFRHIGRHDPGALQAVKRHLDGYPGVAEDALAIKAILQLAYILESSRKFAEAREFCDVVLERDPDNSVAKAMKDKLGTGEVELAMVLRAMAEEKGMYGKGHWFQCPNGHLYTIGECGGATEESKCPDCDATVGGGRHCLAAGNRPSNIDGSDPSAYGWSGGQRF